MSREDDPSRSHPSAQLPSCGELINSMLDDGHGPVEYHDPNGGPTIVRPQRSSLDSAVLNRPVRNLRPTITTRERLAERLRPSNAPTHLLPAGPIPSAVEPTVHSQSHGPWPVAPNQNQAGQSTAYSVYWAPQSLGSDGAAPGSSFGDRPAFPTQWAGTRPSETGNRSSGSGPVNHSRGTSHSNGVRSSRSQRPGQDPRQRPEPSQRRRGPPTRELMSQGASPWARTSDPALPSSCPNCGSSREWTADGGTECADCLYMNFRV